MDGRSITPSLNFGRHIHRDVSRHPLIPVASMDWVKRLFVVVVNTVIRPPSYAVLIF